MPLQYVYEKGKIFEYYEIGVLTGLVGNGSFLSKKQEFNLPP
jgi:hypothetical protein